MAIVKGRGLTLNGQDIAWFKYNDANLKLHSFEWNVPAGHALRIQVFENKVSTFDRTLGAGSGSQNIPGNYGVTVDEEGDIILPAGWEYRIAVESVG